MTYNRNGVFSGDRMYTYVKGFADGAGLEETRKALVFARECHSQQKRKSGEPYITHPLTMACHALALGIREDDIIASAILHDVVEDCGITYLDLPVKYSIRDVIYDLSYKKPTDGNETEAKQEYYEKISKNRIATLVKLIDRCHNVSTMAGTFTKEKIDEYIKETRDFVLPLLQYAKEKYPNDSEVLFVLKYHIVTMIDSIEAAKEAYK